MKIALMLLALLLVSFTSADMLLDSVVFKTDSKHDMKGFSAAYAPENYGYLSNETDAVLVWQPGCSPDSDSAEFTLNATSSAEYVWVRMLNSYADDSYTLDIMYNDTWVYLGEFVDSGYSENVVTSLFFFPPFNAWEGDLSFRIRATGVPYGDCENGQLSITSAALFSSSGNSGGNGGSFRGAPSSEGENNEGDGEKRDFRQETQEVPEFGTFAALGAAIAGILIIGIRRS